MNPEVLRGLDDVALVSHAIANELVFKRVHTELEARPASEAAARQMIDAYRRGEVAPWLTAALLGACRHAEGYDTLREILLAAPGQLAESYAGPAMARVRGEAALDDLLDLIMTAPKRISREGAAYGLQLFNTPDARVSVLEATRAKQIRRRTGAWILGKMEPDEGLVLELLRSPGEMGVGLGTEVLWSCIKAVVVGTPEAEQPALAMHPSAELRRVVADVLNDTTTRMHPRKREDLRAWVGAP